ncbi:transmembrane protein 67-domain-containing protein [Catenaria anguillulae PL171]|uniref:Transmembrane protein 67-domain-containing protein n=1 Tax=Catenaria anguillulae PL171 TaxID=765915 RepID=A0A1Y2I498_9FUNG|nr:transmembrane protein 67-domain-containing protein [Catenaria anguillulae PL171]
MQAVYANHEILSVNVSAATSGVVNQQLISSPLLAATFLPSLYQCSQGNPAPQGVSPTACQRVANLCALAYGDPAHPICIAYLTSLLAQAPPSSLPAKDSRVTLGSAYSTTGAINVTIASYWLNGTIDSVQPWASWLSGVCGDVASSITSTSSSNPLSLIAGVGSMARCSLSMAKSANRIFEAYLIDLTGYHWPIPIFVAKGSRTRRFFFVTRVATSVALSFPMLGAESYGLPHISITHKESALSTTTPTFAPLVTTVEYILDTHSFWDMFHIGAPVASVMVGAIWLARVSSPSRQHVNLADPWSAIQMLDLLLEMIAPGTALATGVIMVYVWVFYTFQGGAAGGKWFMWLPGPLDEKSFRDAVLAALVLQAVHIAVVLYAQVVRTRVYLIDWEKPVKDGSPVSTWRAVHAARKYIETAGYARSIAGWACLLAALVPIKSDSWFLACAEHTLVILGLWCGIYMLRTLLIEPYFSNPPLEFVDFLSIVNISVLILAPNSDPCAYYLHGRSVFPVTDTDMSTVQANLKREATDAVSRRGLTNTDDVLFTVKPSMGLVKALDTIENVFAADMLSNPLGSPTSPAQTGGGQDTDPLLLLGQRGAACTQGGSCHRFKYRYSG